jgi:hypothetical protein
MPRTNDDLRRGLIANAYCLPTEDRDSFNRLLAAYLDEYNPQTATERRLVHQLATAEWREHRAACAEAHIVAVAAARQSPDIEREFAKADRATRNALAFEHKANTGRALSLLNQYEARMSRNYRFALRELRRPPAARKQILPNDPTDLFETKQRAA